MKTKILIVDDVKANLLSMEHVLVSGDYDVFQAQSGNEALSLLLENEFALVLLDVRMPDIGGFEMAELMRSNERTKYIPIIFITALSPDEDFVFKGYESGAIDILFKPLNPIILRSKVKVFCDLYIQKEELKRSLREKDFLMKEIHHRVKNNLSMVNSFINLQKDMVEEKSPLDVLMEIETRISSISLIHEKLYTGGDLDSVEIKEYLIDIITRLVDTMNSRVNIRLDLDIETVQLPVDTSIYLGLIITELTTNSLKYAFPDGTPGSIRVRLASADASGSYVLVFQDDGIGMPVSFDPADSTSLGLILISEFTSQLGGTVSVDRAHGTQYTIPFKVGRQ